MPGDVIECHGVRQRATYEFGAYALVKLEGQSGRTASRSCLLDKI